MDGSEAPDVDAVLAANTRESLAALSHAELLDVATALAARLRALQPSRAAESGGIYVLPDELLSRALHALPLVSRLRACAVSRRFRRLLYTPALRAALDPAHVLLSGRSLPPDGRISSPDGRFVLVYQGDANLVLHARRGSPESLVPIWALQTVNVPYNHYRAGQLVLRENGSVEVLDSYGHRYWAPLMTRFGVAPFRLVVRPEGDFAVIDANDVPTTSPCGPPRSAETDGGT